VDDLAPGERVYSARFDGEIAYFTTFRNVDPLFAADLSDPANPKILSALKISGFSEYLHNWNENRLFGLGREANEENGWAEGLKLVMFDTSDKTNVTAKHTLVLDDASYSEALYDHKAVFIDPARGYIGFATQEEYRVYTYDDANGFRLAARFDFGTWPMFARGFRIGEQAYVVTGNEVCVLQLPDWSRVKFCEIAEK
ncbi:MAG: beta-propeller domain-containing protein, partial [Oscillospiraceae bacterium]|nr:beta-propeller domain-containing protein [Oscillospiraceae bacterium]